MKFLKYLFLALVLLSINTKTIYAQTTSDYFEKMRLERKEKKIKTISAYDYFDDALSKKDYFDENGFLVKKEIYGSSFITGDSYILQDIIVDEYKEGEDMSGTAIIFETDGSKTKDHKFSNMKPEIFFETSSFENVSYDKVQYLFDNKDNITEKRFYKDKEYKPTEYEKLLIYYDSENKPIESKFFTPNNSTVSFGKYYYNSNGLLEKEESSYDFQKGERVYGVRYEYEFF